MRTDEPVVIPPDVWQAILAHVKRQAPAEAVGLLGGSAHSTVRAEPLTNIASPFAFLADPYAQYLAEKRFKQEGLRVVASYHSHPGGGTGLSAEDERLVRAVPCIHVVVATSWDGGEVRGVAAYQFRDGRICEVGVSAA